MFVSFRSKRTGRGPEDWDVTATKAESEPRINTDEVGDIAVELCMVDYDEEVESRGAIPPTSVPHEAPWRVRKPQPLLVPVLDTCACRS